MKNTLTITKVLGIPIRLNLSWFLIAALITYSLASGFFPGQLPAASSSVYWLLGGLTALLFFASVLTHELGHAVVALWEKIPVRSITLFIFGGVAEIDREPDTAGGEFRIAIAGPLTSLALAAGFGLLSPLLAALDTPLAVATAYLSRINLMLALFNLVPGFPLDGGRVLRSLLWKLRGNLTQATFWATQVGRGVAWLFIGSGLFQVLTGNLLDGIWIGFIGLFLSNAAQSSYRQVLLQEQLRGVTAKEIPPQLCPVVPADASLDRLVAEEILGRGNRCFFVTQNDQLAGLVTWEQIKSLPRSQWPFATASQVMTPTYALAWAQPNEGAWALLQRMESSQVHQLPMKDGNRPVGMISRDRLLYHVRLLKELGG